MSLGRVQLCDTAGIIISPTTTCLKNKRSKKCKKCRFYNHDPVPVSTFRLWQKNPSRWFQANWTCRLPGRMSLYCFVLVFMISFSGHWLLWESLPPNRDNLCRPENIFAAKSQFLLFISIIIMTLVILGIISIINIRQISCFFLCFTWSSSIVTTQVGVPDSKIALHVNVHFYTDKVMVTNMMPLL